MDTGSGSQARHGRGAILLAVQRAELLRRYEPTLRLLVDRGHRVDIASEETGGADPVGQLAQAWPGPAVEASAGRDASPWPPFARAIRPLAERGPSAGKALLGRLGRTTPADERLRAALEATRPTLVVAFAPLDPASRSRDLVETARLVGIPTAVCIDGWTDLARSGALHVEPDRIFVWSAAQRERAIAEGAAGATVVVTGAQGFDGIPERDRGSREELCELVGLDSRRPFVLFAGSPHTGAGAEPFFVERWLRRIRGAVDADVAAVGVLVRPHPSNERRYLSFDVSQLDNVAVWPPSGHSAGGHLAPGGALRLSAGVVALDMSSLPEAVAAGRPFLAFAGPDLEPADGAALESITPEARGLVHVAADFEEHLHDLARLLHGELGGERATSAERLGLSYDAGRPAAVVLADAIEAACELGAEPRARRRADPLLRAALWPVAHLAARRERRAQAPGEIPAWLPLARPLVRGWIRLLVVRAYAADLWRRRRSVRSRATRLLRR